MCFVKGLLCQQRYKIPPIDTENYSGAIGGCDRRSQINVYLAKCLVTTDRPTDRRHCVTQVSRFLKNKLCEEYLLARDRKLCFYPLQRARNRFRASPRTWNTTPLPKIPNRNNFAKIETHISVIFVKTWWES